MEMLLIALIWLLIISGVMLLGVPYNILVEKIKSKKKGKKDK